MRYLASSISACWNNAVSRPTSWSADCRLRLASSSAVRALLVPKAVNRATFEAAWSCATVPESSEARACRTAASWPDASTMTRRSPTATLSPSFFSTVRTVPDTVAVTLTGWSVAMRPFTARTRDKGLGAIVSTATVEILATQGWKYQSATPAAKTNAVASAQNQGRLRSSLGAVAMRNAGTLAGRDSCGSTLGKEASSPVFSVFKLCISLAHPTRNGPFLVAP
jgi:hypothetical protein